MSDTLFAADETLFSAAEFSAELATAASPIAAFKQTLKNAQALMDERFIQGEDIRKLIYGRAWLVDQLLLQAWNLFEWPDNNGFALIAVGGYGRGELHPHSDVDLLILLDAVEDEQMQASISGFLTLLWDINLDIGSSVRTLEECYQEAVKDITIATNLIESRLITGSQNLHDRIFHRVTSGAWSDKEFFLAKIDEQKSRHDKTNDTEYNLEPNLKTSPGGLRDLQTIGWVAKRHFGTTFIHDLVDHGFVTESELDTLEKGERYLWTVRYALHMHCKRREDRLLFDHQRTLADLFGYKNQDGALAVEQFMVKYYRVAKTMSEFNNMLLQYFDEVILSVGEEQIIEPLNKRFNLHNGYIKAAYPSVFEHHPFAMMELFVLLAENEEIKGVRASTIRLILNNRHRIDDDFRKDIRNISLFMELLRGNLKVSTELKRMNRFGILGRYLPEFGEIIGQMQHDLFHIYTVDAHTLKVVQKLRQFRHTDNSEQFPIAHRIINQIPKIELIYIAGLYHDIGKGRGGDHSELGAEDVKLFCERHHLGKWDTHLVTWLVRNHLLMSMTAQRKDISDPDVIQHFAKQVRDLDHLDHLYILTVADINATNHTLWNSWRAALLRQLYSDTKIALQRGLENPINKEDRIEQTQHEAMVQLQRNGCGGMEVLSFWEHLGDEYFLREQATNIAWQTRAILEHGDSDLPLVKMHETSRRSFEGATEVFIYMRDQPNLFAAAASALDQLNLNIQDARIMVADNNQQTLNTYTVLAADNQPLTDNAAHLEYIQQSLVTALNNPEEYPNIIHRRTPRQLKLFANPTRVNIINDTDKQLTTLEVMTPDRPGLLARLGRIFMTHGISVRNAKIVSIGERVEDYFFISDIHGNPLTDDALCDALQKDICQQLDEHIQAEQ